MNFNYFTNQIKKKIIMMAILGILMLSVFVHPIQATKPIVPSLESTKEIKNIQEWVNNQGYHYTVSKNWVTQLSPKEREALYGYRQVVGPIKTPSNNKRSFSPMPKFGVEKFENTKNLSFVQSSLPTSYDAMALGYVTTVKNQGVCGACWIFAAIADLESDVALGELKLLDFSEQEAGDCNIFSSVGGFDPCSGGNAHMTTNYFTKFGSSNESLHTYKATPEYCYNSPIQKNVNNWRIITGPNGEHQSQIAIIKNAILAYGPVDSSIYAGDTGFGSYSGGVYEYWGSEGVNHAIQIIGWNDSKVHSKGTGAWLIKNSWGTSWGALGPYPGCAWVAYGSANLGDYTSAISGYKDPGDEIFYHDEGGWMNWALGDGSTTAYGAVRFVPTNSTTLNAVDFWAVDPNMAYEIKIFDTLNDLGGGNYSFNTQLGIIQTGTTNEPGYYSIPLSMPIPLTIGDDFIIQVKFTSASGYQIPIEYYDASSHPWLPMPPIFKFSNESYHYNTSLSAFIKPAEDIGIRARAKKPLPVQNLDTGENFSTIQAAIDAQNTTGGDSITVDPGTYIENVDIYKSLTIRSSSGNATDTIVRAANSDDHVFEVNSDYVNIEGFTFENATGVNKVGIYLGSGVNSCEITKNSVLGNHHGIYLHASSDNHIAYNYITRNNVGGFVLVGGSIRNNISFNHILANGEYNSTTGGYEYNFINNQSNDVNATDNWWGTNDNDIINASIYDWNNVATNGNITFLPKLDNPAPLVPIPELKSITLFLIGLIVFVGYYGFGKRKKF